VIYEWHPKKAKANLRKHRVSFEEAASVFLDRSRLPIPTHTSEEEFREITIGHSAKQGVIFLSHTQRSDRIRIIGARKATRWERKQYEESIGKEKQ
jgi:uncharacterized protein